MIIIIQQFPNLSVEQVAVMTRNQRIWPSLLYIVVRKSMANKLWPADA